MKTIKEILTESSSKEFVTFWPVFERIVDQFEKRMKSLGVPVKMTRKNEGKGTTATGRYGNAKDYFSFFFHWQQEQNGVIRFYYAPSGFTNGRYNEDKDMERLERSYTVANGKILDWRGKAIEWKLLGRLLADEWYKLMTKHGKPSWMNEREITRLRTNVELNIDVSAIGTRHSDQRQGQRTISDSEIRSTILKSLDKLVQAFWDKKFKPGEEVRIYDPANDHLNLIVTFNMQPDGQPEKVVVVTAMKNRDFKSPNYMVKV